MPDHKARQTDPYEKTAAIALGANLDLPGDMIVEATLRLSRLPGLRLTAASSMYLTEPQGGPIDQNWYHNGVALFDCELAPRALLDETVKIEAAMGRFRNERWGPRLIDLDLIFFGSRVIFDPPTLFLPHPRMYLRRFVLAPLAELAPDWRHPERKQSVREMLAILPEEDQAIKRLDVSITGEGRV